MWMSRKTHEALLAAAKHEANAIAEAGDLMLGLKDAHVAALENEIKFLRRLVQPSGKATDGQLEADGLLEGRDVQIERDDKKAALDSEAARILSGNY